MVLVIAAFCLSGSRSGEPTPPTYMLVLPISSRMLVVVPMLAGAATIFAVWFIVASFVLRPADFPVPIFWPALFLILFQTLFQAIAWTPFAQKWMQGILTIFAGAGTFGWVVGGIAFGFARFGLPAEPYFTAGIVLPLLVVAYFAALSGVAMTRRGDSYEWRLWSRLIEWLNTWRKPADHPFSSARTAQVWFEMRSGGWYPPLMTAGMGLFFLIPMLLDHPSDLGQTWKFLGIFLGVQVFIAGVAGPSLGNVGGLDYSAKSSLDSFLFARPISSVAVVRDKLLSGAVSALLIWLAALPFGLLIFLRPGFFQAIVEIARQSPAWKVALLPPLAVLLILLVTWKQMVEGFWVALTGRVWLIHIFGIGMVLLMMGGIGFGIWINIFPAYQPLALAVSHWIMDVLLVVKLVVALLVLRALMNRAIMPTESIVAMVALWVFVVALFGSTALWLVPSGVVKTSDILSGIVLLVPFSRLAGAPLAVEWNRHR